MKERYETPKCDIIVFETEDIISTSTLGEGGNEESFPISIG